MIPDTIGLQSGLGLKGLLTLEVLNMQSSFPFTLEVNS